VQRIIAQAESEALQKHMAKLDWLIPELERIWKERMLKQTDEYREQPMVTLATIDARHGVPEGTAAESFGQNHEQFAEGIDFFSMECGEYLFTRAGYLKIIMPFDDDLAWRVHCEVVKFYLAARKEKEAQAALLDRVLDRLVEDPATIRNALLNYGTSTAKPTRAAAV
jgi:hypothetical protein